MTEQKPSGNRTGKRIFIAVIIIVVIGIYMQQRKAILLEGWGDNLDAAMAQAKAENKIVVAFFTNSSPSATARKVAVRLSVPETQKMLIESGKYVLVHVSTSLDSETAKKYNITELPTFIAFTPDGKERNRVSGNVGEVPFRSEFLENSGKDK